MSDASDDDGAAAPDATPRGAPEPEALEDREEGGSETSEIPPAARDHDANYQDKYDEAREDENPDQHRDDEAYD